MRIIDITSYLCRHDQITHHREAQLFEKRLDLLALLATHEQPAGPDALKQERLKPHAPKDRIKLFLNRQMKNQGVGQARRHGLAGPRIECLAQDRRERVNDRVSYSCGWRHKKVPWGTVTCKMNSTWEKWKGKA